MRSNRTQLLYLQTTRTQQRHWSKHSCTQLVSTRERPQQQRMVFQIDCISWRSLVLVPRRWGHKVFWMQGRYMLNHCLLLKCIPPRWLLMGEQIFQLVGTLWQRVIQQQSQRRSWVKHHWKVYGSISLCTSSKRSKQKVEPTQLSQRQRY